ncbi:MAG: hypothetical protein OYK82_12360 [Gammaproteobacteria bacterium]|nr:hypothetical protein [Gammaproteobacteria bacterium]
MSRWTKLVKPPEGALPGGLVMKAGVVLTAVLVGALLFSLAMTGPEEEAAAPGAPIQARAVDDGLGRSLQDRIRQEADRQTLEAATRARAEFESRQAAAVEETARRQAELEAAGPSAGGVSTPEWELREALRLEELERRTRSLRAPSVALSYRDPNGGAASSGAAGGRAEDAADADVALLENAVQAALASFGESVAALETELEAGLAGGQLVLGPTTAAAMAPAAPSPRRTPGTAQPGRLVAPADPPGWERIHEGSFLEAVLLTQLSGEFPGPVLATVSVPFYSADRQRVLIPRGTRAIGTAQAVRDRDQSRLAVGFHRLVLPDGSWIDLEFDGLNQAGESALIDEIDRHYFSTFAAAGAVGVVSGLALAGGSPFGLMGGVGQGLGQSTAAMLDRYLNRLPTITIRAGHRLRIWFTSDVLVPRTGTRP